MPVLFKRGDLFAQDAEALVNTVNCVGVMGRGVALEFKRRWPKNYAAYRIACNRKSLRPGVLHIFQVSDLLSHEDPKFIINFPTKDHWRAKSQLSYIEDGLDALVETLMRKRITSIAMPPLGCGNGGLSWHDVKPLIEEKLSGISDVEIVVLEPHTQDEYPEHSTSSLAMTYSRAVLIRTLAELENLFDGSFDRLSLQKIVYFLQALGVPFNVDFDQRLFGPFSAELKKAFFALERQGFLEGFSSEDRSAHVPAGAYASADDFLKSSAEDSNAQAVIDRLYHLIEGYEGPFGLELLSSVHQLASTGSNSPEAAVRSLTSRIGVARNRYSEAPIKAAYERLVEDGLISPSKQPTFA